MRSKRPLVYHLACFSIFASAAVFAQTSDSNQSKAAPTSRLELASVYARQTSNDGSDFYGLRATVRPMPRIGIQLGILQSLSSRIADRRVVHHEAFVQTVTQAFRFEGGAVLHFISTKRVTLNSIAGLTLWHSELSPSIEDTPMGDFYNLTPRLVTRLGYQAGLTAAANIRESFSLTLGSRYLYVPTYTFNEVYNAMGMIATQQHSLKWSGLSFEVGLQLGF